MRVFIALGLGILTIAPRVWADAASSEEKAAKAEQLFEQGKKLFHDDQFVKAAAAFRQANALRPNWKILYNIGQSEAAAKRYGMAVEAFQQYLVLGGDDVPLERHNQLLDEIERLRLILGAVTVKAPAGLLVRIDSIQRGTTPLAGPILVTSGIDHRVTIHDENKEVYSAVVRLNGEESRTVSFAEPSEAEETPVLASGTTKPPVADEKGKKLKIAGISLLGVGAAGLIAGAVTGGLALSLDDDIEPHCEPDGCPAEYQDDSERVDNLALATDFLLISGGIIAAAGATLLVVYGLRERRERNTLAVLPSIAPTQVGLTLTKEF
jgi:hypothetical protein